MIKFKTSKKAIRESYYRIISIGYCNAQHLLEYKNAIAYSTRSEGWSCDYYSINGILFSTGYSPLQNKNVKCSYETIRKYEDLARENTCSSLPYEEKERINEELLSQFINEVVEGDN